jgi:hypothetical protein
MPKMKLDTLKAILAAERSSALASLSSSKLTKDRADAMDYYYGDMTTALPTEIGRSQAVSTDVQDTVEGLMPQLMDIFAGSEEVVRFLPTSPDDIEAAEQESDYVNHVFLKHGGFLTLYSMIKDALLSKTGLVKVSWREEKYRRKETYLDQDDETFKYLSTLPDAEPVEHTEKPDPNVSRETIGPPAMSPPAMLHDVTLLFKETRGYPLCEPVPPEEFGISRNARGIKDAGYTFHEVQKTQAELIEQGYDKKQIEALPSWTDVAKTESTSRDTVDESMVGSDDINKANRTVMVTEHYPVLDYEGDGDARLYRITTGGESGEILKRDGKEDIVEWDEQPFAAITPVIVTHRFWGRSVADLVMDIQRIKTALLRSLLDNAYLANNPRTEISESHASENTIDDLLVSRPSGVVRTRQPGGLNTLTTPPIGGHVFPMIEYMDATREWRTGVTRQGQGIDANVLQNQSATATVQAFNASQARAKLIARIFAETGIKDMFTLLHAVIRKNGSKAETVRLRGKWVQVDPRHWRERNDMTVSVGLGTGGKAERLQNHMLIVQAQTSALQAGLTNLVSQSNLFNSAKHLVTLTGNKNVEEFFTDPATQPPLQPKPDPKMLELQAKNEIEKTQAAADIATTNRKVEAEIALAQQKFAFEREAMQAEFQLKIAEMNAELQIEREKNQSDMAMKTQAHHQQMELEEKKANGHATIVTSPDGSTHVIPSKNQNDKIAKLDPILKEIAEHMRHANMPKRIVRDKNNRVSHLEVVQ